MVHVKENRAYGLEHKELNSDPVVLLLDDIGPVFHVEIQIGYVSE